MVRESSNNLETAMELKGVVVEVMVMVLEVAVVWSEVEKGVEHGSIAARRKWTEPFLAEGFRPSLPHLS